MREILKNNETMVKIYDKFKQIYFEHIVSDERLIKKQFIKRLGQELNIKNPIKFNEKLQWLKLNWYDPEAVKCADKYKVREIIKEKIGEEYLNEIIGIYESTKEINVDELPDKFVLKGTHGSGYNIICTDKSKLDWEKEFKKMRRWLRTNYYWTSREWPYKNIKPRIICEKYLIDETGTDLKDYKFMCFNGEPKIIQVISERRSSSYLINHFDVEWNEIDIPRKTLRVNLYAPAKPKYLKNMIEISKTLSKDIPFVRIDLYETGKSVYFGEMTFFPVSGFMDFKREKDDLLLGSWIELPKGD